MSRWIRLASALLLCTGQTACHDTPVPTPAVTASDGAIALAADAPLRQRLRFETLQPRPIRRPLQAPGVIEAIPEQQVQILTPLPGRLLRIDRALGATVKRGDPLLLLDSAELANARSEAAKAHTAAAQARRAQQRSQRLFDAEIGARRDLEEAQQALEDATSDARAADALLRQLGITDVRGNGREYVLRAPIDGRVIDLQAAQGGYWNDINAPLMTVADLSRVRLTAQVPERQLGQVFVGQPVRITLSALPGEVLHGEVAQIGDVLDAQTRATPVRVLLDNHDGRLRPGMYAQVQLEGRPEPALTVPTGALLQDGLATRVYVEAANQRFVPRIVQVGAALGERVEIVSGLQAGERVVVENGALLHD